MKKILLALAFLSVIMMSCKKRQCFKCMVISTINLYDYNHSITSDTTHTELCDKTQDDINKYIQQQTSTRSTVHGGTINQRAECK